MDGLTADTYVGLLSKYGMPDHLCAMEENVTHISGAKLAGGQSCGTNYPALWREQSLSLLPPGPHDKDWPGGWATLCN